MKTTLRLLLFAAAFAGAAILLQGCSSAHKRSTSTHELWEYSTATPPNGKPVSLLVRHEVWTDLHRGGGAALLADPKASALASSFTNQVHLGGSSAFNVGDLAAPVNTAAIEAAGKGIGDIVQKVIEGAKGVKAVEPFAPLK